MNKFHIHVTSSDSLGMNLIENVIQLANLGAVMKPGTIPAMRFPHSVSMILEAEDAPYTSACIRVFEFDSNQEIKNPKPVESIVSVGFSMDEEEKIDEEEVEEEDKVIEEVIEEVIEDKVIEEEEVIVDKPKVYTKEELQAMDFETEFREVCKAVGVVGRGRDKMTKEYLEKVA